MATPAPGSAGAPPPIVPPRSHLRAAPPAPILTYPTSLSTSTTASQPHALGVPRNPSWSSANGSSSRSSSSSYEDGDHRRPATDYNHHHHHHGLPTPALSSSSSSDGSPEIVKSPTMPSNPHVHQRKSSGSSFLPQSSVITFGGNKKHDRNRSISGSRDPLKVHDGIEKKASSSGVYTPVSFPGACGPTTTIRSTSISSTSSEDSAPPRTPQLDPSATMMTTSVPSGNRLHVKGKTFTGLRRISESIQTSLTPQWQGQGQSHHGSHTKAAPSSSSSASSWRDSYFSQQGRITDEPAPLNAWITPTSTVPAPPQPAPVATPSTPTFYTYSPPMHASPSPGKYSPPAPSWNEYTATAGLGLGVDRGSVSSTYPAPSGAEKVVVINADPVSPPTSPNRPRAQSSAAVRRKPVPRLDENVAA